MSSKKKDKNEWAQCNNCGNYYPRVIILKHGKSCLCDADITPEDSLNLSIRSDGGFIENSVFNGTFKPIDTLQTTLPSNKQDLVLVHPNTLKFLNLQVSSHVTLNFIDEKTYCTLWPCSSLPIDSISMSRQKDKILGCKLNELVQLLPCDSVVTKATTLTLKPISEESSIIFDDIKYSLQCNLDDSIILPNEEIDCLYYGKHYTYKVHEITDNQIELTNDFSTVLKSFKALNIDKMSTPTKKSMIKENISFVHCISFIETTINLYTEPEIKSSKQPNPKSYEMLGGLFTQKKELYDNIVLPMTKPKLFKDLCISMPKGVILYGPSGTGKTKLTTGLIDLLPNVYFDKIDGPELTSKYVGETEQRLRDIFECARQKAPSILIIDEFDAVCPVRSSSTNDSEKRIVATMLKLMDSIPDDIQLVVIAITNNLSAVDMSLRRSGRFEKEIEVTAPNAKERLDVIQKIMLCKKHELTDSDIIEISEITHGFVPSDLASLCKEAGNVAMQNMIKNSRNIDNVDLNQFNLKIDCFKQALLKIGPSALKAVTVDIPKVYWKDVGGQNKVKQKLKESIEWPLKHPGVFHRMGISPPKGLLMYGPPGCSKTLMAKALATESGLNFISIKGPELFNKYLGESEKAVREVFHKARAAAPSIIFFDEIDALGVKRSGGNSGGSNVADRVLAQLLTELDGVEGLNGVIIVAATNRPDVIDSALLRPGRIDRMIYVPLPGDLTRKEIFEIQFRTIPISDDVSIEELVKLSKGYSGAEICSLCREAAIIALRENFSCVKVEQKHLEIIFNQIKPATSNEMITFYDNFVSKTTGSF